MKVVSLLRRETCHSCLTERGPRVGEWTATALNRSTMPGPVTDQRAHALRARYHELFGRQELPVPVESIAEDLLGLTIYEEDLDVLSGVLYPDERRIEVNASDIPARKRFTVAHELGHWVCQCLEGRGHEVMCRVEDLSPDVDRTLEREANVFAAELLMPEPAVRAAAAEADAARRFGVSSQAMQWRLYSFGLAERPTTSADLARE
jgi:IrrE N-terminal-like domain